MGSILLDSPPAHAGFNREAARRVPWPKAAMRRTASDATNGNSDNKKAAGTDPDG
jgi:hypothetical protein